MRTTRWGFHTARVEAIVWNRRGTHVVTASLDTNVFVYGVAEPGRNWKVLNAHMGGVGAVAWEQEEGEGEGKGEVGVVSAGADGCVKRWGVKLA